MKIPFTVEQFFNVFAQYNTAIWPAQIVAYLLAAAALTMVFMNKPFAGRLMSATLGVFWVWMGAVYHIAHFRGINPAALAFGIAFIVQGALFFVLGVARPGISFSFVRTPVAVVGLLFVLYAMAIYPVLGMTFGHHYPSVPMFGVAPCPTTIFTFGALLWATSTVPALLLPIPLLWSLVGMSAAVSLQVPQDYGLVVAGVLGTVLIVIQNRRRRSIREGGAAGQSRLHGG